VVKIHFSNWYKLGQKTTEDILSSILTLRAYVCFSHALMGLAILFPFTTILWEEDLSSNHLHFCVLISSFS